MDENELLHNESLKDTTIKSNIYNKWAISYDNYVDKKHYTGPNELIDILYKYIKSNSAFDETIKKNILDFGCGTGLVGAQLRKKMIITSLHGIDISTKMLDICKQKTLYNNLYNIDLSKDTLQNNILYDYIISSGVFLEGHADISLILELTKYLKNNGIMIFTIRQTYLNNNINKFNKITKYNKNIIVVNAFNINYLFNVKCKLYILKKI